MPRHRFHHIARRQIIKRRHRGARIPGRKKLVLAIIEAERQHRQHAIIGAKRQIGRDTLGTEPQIGVTEHHALGPSGRSAGIENGDQIAGIARRRGQALRMAVDRRLDRGQIAQRTAAGKAVAQHVGSRAIGQQQRCATVGQNMRDLRCLQQRIDRHMDQPAARRGERHQAGSARLCAPARHTVAGPGARGAQPCR